MSTFLSNLPRLYIESDFLGTKSLQLSQQQSHYLLHVLRLKLGNHIFVFNGKQGEWRATITQTSRRSCDISIDEQVRKQTRPSDAHYYFAPLKHARLDYMMQKATEMGASHIQPIITGRTNVSRFNMDRARSNIIEAAEQCGILSIPYLGELISFETLFANWDSSRTLIFCDELAELKDPINTLDEIEDSRVAILIGPEGGFDKDERDFLLSRTYVVPISLGPRTLRADTAGVAALSLVQTVFSDWEGDDGLE